MNGTFEGKVALVSGAASGIGRASSMALAKKGVRVVVADISVEGGQETAKLITGAGGQARFIRTDITKADDIRAAVAYVVDSYGRLDIAHNNAGILATTLLLADDAEAVFDKVVTTNAKSIMLSMKYEIEHMLKQGGGRIVNTASVLGLVGGLGQWAYAASKHAVVGLTRALAVEYAPQGIRINAVCPGAVRTPMTAAMVADPALEQGTAALHPIGRIANPEEIASAVVWLASDDSSYMIGAAVPVDGGFTAV